MLIYTEKLYFKSPIDHVFKSLTCFEFNKHFFTNSLRKMDRRDTKHVKLIYNKELDELTVLSEKPLFKITSDESERNKYASGMVVPLADTLKRLGAAKVECWFSEKDGITEVYCEVNSFKEPGIIWKIFTKIIVFVHKYQNKEDSTDYIKYVESSA